MRLSDLDGRRIGVWGAGRDGAAAVRHLHGHAAVILMSDSPGTDVAARGLAAEYGLALVHPDEVDPARLDAIVRSPGVSRYKQRVAEFTAAGVPSSNLLALWLAEHPEAAVIGVTGTKGKSTTATLVTMLLEDAGVDVGLAGNIGVPVTALRHDHAVTVLEVSSYQASDVERSPRLGVLTSLGEDHVAWHGSVERYRADKLNLFRHDGLASLLTHDDDAELLAAVADLADVRLGAGSGGWRLDWGAGGATSLVSGHERVVLRGTVGRGPNPRNLLLAVRAVERHLGQVPERVVAATVGRFRGLPSRLAEIATVAGVTYVDDALASNPLGCLTAVEAFAGDGVVLIVGGADRGVDLDPLAAGLRAAPDVRAVVAISATGAGIERALGGAPFPVVRLDSDDVAEAVGVASGLAQPGDAVIFSPAAPTPAALGTYEDRSRTFVAAVEALAAATGGGPPSGRST